MLVLRLVHVEFDLQVVFLKHVFLCIPYNVFCTLRSVQAHLLKTSVNTIPLFLGLAFFLSWRSFHICMYFVLMAALYSTV